MWNTYYYLEEALKTQTPKLIILDAYVFCIKTETDTTRAIKGTYGMKWSQTKIDAIKASFDTEEYGYQFMFPLLQYHSRYSDLDEVDFYSYRANEALYKNYKGFSPNFATTSHEEKDYSEITSLIFPSDKIQTYYTKIFELASSNNIPVVVTAIPCNATNDQMAYLNAAKLIAEDYGYPFLNFMTEYKEALGLDYNTDFADESHLNYIGSTKLARFLGDYISENYSVPDRRGDDNYTSWDEDTNAYYDRVANLDVLDVTNIEEYGDVVNNDRYTVIITKSGTFDKDGETSVDDLNTFRVIAGIDEEQFSQGGVWLFESGQFVYYDDCTDESFQKSIELSRFDDAMVKSSSGDDGVTIDIYVNKSNVSKVDSGLNVYVYDTLTQSTVDSIGVDFSTGLFVRAS